ncbi:MAG: metallophosphoesterase family protein [Candidatus Eiseniibacteriota bacterium]
MAVARFLQVSDLHLGRPFGWLPQERRNERRSDQRHALERVVREAIERGVSAILIPGDLFDQDGTDADTLAFVLGAFRVAGCPPVLIAPGNHDPYWDASPNWSARVLGVRGQSWPEHVHIFRTPEWMPKTIESIPGVRFWGRCFSTSGVSNERPLSSAALGPVRPSDPPLLEVALFHGSREGQCPPGQKITAPFSDAEAQAAPFAYMAVGHYHGGAGLQLSADGARASGVRLAYSGSALALDLGETGRHGALDVRLEYGIGVPDISAEFVELDRRKVFDITADVNGASSAEEVDRRVQKACDQAGVSDTDMAIVRVQGRIATGVRYSGPGQELRARAFHLRLDLKGVRPDYDLEAFMMRGPRTTEERFACALLEQLVTEKNPDQRAVLYSAIYYGLDAFRLREVVPAYEEMGAS